MKISFSHRELGALRHRLIHQPSTFSVPELRVLATSLEVTLPKASLLRRKRDFIEAILAEIGRPFDREARDALAAVPVMLWEHSNPKGVPRNLRRHAWSTKTISRTEKVQVSRTIPKRYRRAALFVPATARDLMLARVALATSGRGVVVDEVGR